MAAAVSSAGGVIMAYQRQYQRWRSSTLAPHESMRRIA